MKEGGTPALDIRQALAELLYFESPNVVRSQLIYFTVLLFACFVQ